MIDRRTILRGALFGAGTAVFPRRVVAAMTRAATAGSLGNAPANGQVLFVFLRGGNDATNTLIPSHDTTYVQARPNLFVPDAEHIPITGVNFTSLSPWLQRLSKVERAGRLAMLHRVGDPAALRSHFIAMDMFETAAEQTVSLSDLSERDGFVNKILATAGIPSLDAQAVPAAVSLSTLQQRMFRTRDAASLAAHAASLTPNNLALPSPVPQVGIAGALYAHAADHALNPVTPTDALLAGNLGFGLDTNAALQLLGFAPGFSAANPLFPVTSNDIATVQAQNPGSAVVPTYDPKGSAFISAAEQAFFALANRPSLRVAGVEFGGWDTHGDQPGEHPNLLRYLGWGMRDLDDAISAAGLGSRITVIVVSEFGRTNRENSGSSTDHGVGGLYFAMGESVRGGTYNCHGGPTMAQGPREFGAPWVPLIPPTPSPPQYDNALEVATDFRDVLAEVCSKCFGIPDAALGNVITGYTAPITPWLDFLA